MKYLSIFLTGFVQVFFVSVNTYFIAKEKYYGVFIAAFIISIIWSYNVKRIAFGSNLDRFLYAFGAAIGSIFGLWISAIILKKPLL
jgi:hypothetical protein